MSKRLSFYRDVAVFALSMVHQDQAGHQISGPRHDRAHHPDWQAQSYEPSAARVARSLGRAAKLCRAAVHSRLQEGRGSLSCIEGAI